MTQIENSSESPNPELGWRSRWATTVSGGITYGKPVATREAAIADRDVPEGGTLKLGVQFWMENVGWVTDKTDAPGTRPAPVTAEAEHDRLLAGVLVRLTKAATDLNIGRRTVYESDVMVANRVPVLSVNGALVDLTLPEFAALLVRVQP